MKYRKGQITHDPKSIADYRGVCRRIAANRPLLFQPVSHPFFDVVFVSGRADSVGAPVRLWQLIFRRAQGWVIGQGEQGENLF